MEAEEYLETSLCPEDMNFMFEWQEQYLTSNRNARYQNSTSFMEGNYIIITVQNLTSLSGTVISIRTFL